MSRNIHCMPKSGTLLYGFCLQFIPLSNGERICENRLSFDKVIAISWTPLQMSDQMVNRLMALDKTHIIYPTIPRVCCCNTCGNLKFKFATNNKRHVRWNEIYQEHMAVIAAVDFRPQIHKDEVRKTKLWDADWHHNRSTKRRSGAQLVVNLWTLTFYR